MDSRVLFVIAFICISQTLSAAVDNKAVQEPSPVVLPVDNQDSLIEADVPVREEEVEPSSVRQARHAYPYFGGYGGHGYYGGYYRSYPSYHGGYHGGYYGYPKYGYSYGYPSYGYYKSYYKPYHYW